MEPTVHNNPASQPLRTRGRWPSRRCRLYPDAWRHHVRAHGGAEGTRRPRRRHGAGAGRARGCPPAGLKVIASCPFITAFMAKHPESNDLPDVAAAPSSIRQSSLLPCSTIARTAHGRMGRLELTNGGSTTPPVRPRRLGCDITEKGARFQDYVETHPHLARPVPSHRWGGL